MEQRVALVVGAIKGIGKGIALNLARSGIAVTLTYYDWKSHLQSLRQDLAATGAPFLIEEVNLLDCGAINTLIEKIIACFGRLDILINNIERGGWPVVHGPYTENQWDLEMATTLRAKRWLFEAALPHLKISGGSSVINISSIAAEIGRSGPAANVFNDGYAAANRGISLLTETWARVGAPTVRVNELMLGFMETRHAEGTRGWSLLSAEQRRSILDHTLMGRTGEINDVVKAIQFLINDAPFMTGSQIRLDGGYILGGEATGPLPKGVVDAGESVMGD